MHLGDLVMGRLVTRFALMGALALAACANSPTPSGIKLSSWNLEHLAEADGAGCRPRTEADFAKLRAYAASLNADVVGLQEVENEAAVHRVFPAETYDVVMSGQPYPAEQGSCGQDASQTFTPQRTALVIRKGIPYSVNAPLEALNVSENSSRPLRWGVDVTIEGKAPLRLLNVHLKSGCSAGAKPSDDDCPVLFRQVPVMESWIDARQAEGASFAILGDFNRRIGPADSEVWQTWDDGDPAGLDLHIAAAEVNAAPQSPGCDNARYPDFIDHIVLSGPAFARVQKGSFAELVFSETGDAMPSDHCPVSVVLTRD
jgi:endonuclease/exonuclease/phosphatase family metal-dependent hydrolase